MEGGRDRGREGWREGGREGENDIYAHNPQTRLSTYIMGLTPNTQQGSTTHSTMEESS